MTVSSPQSAEALEPDAFKKLYPEHFYQTFVDKGIRPDGRPFGQGRPVVVGLGAVETANSSALVKIGDTTVLAGIKLEVLVASYDEKDEGQLNVNVDILPMCSRKLRQSTETAQCCIDQVSRLLTSSRAVDLKKLAIAAGKTAWVAYLDIYVLNADGCLLDACMLASVSCLASLKSLPSVTLQADGKLVEAEGQEIREGEGQGILDLSRLPLTLTCGVYKGQLVADPTAEEEGLMDTSVTITVDPSGRLIGLHKAGGTAEASTVQLMDCIEAAKLRHKEVLEILKQAVA